MTGFLRVKNWERFQHYKDRRPPWIKFHVELLDDHELQLLPYETRLTYCLLLLAAARTDNNIPSDLEYISRQLALPTTLLAGAVQTLIDTGFLVQAERKRDASKALARRKQSAMPRQRRDREEKKGAHTRENTNGNGALFALRTMVENGAMVDEDLLAAEVRDHGLTDLEHRELLTALRKRRAAA